MDEKEYIEREVATDRYSSRKGEGGGKMKEYIEKDTALETTYEPFTMSMCMTALECNGMNRAREMIFKQLRDIPAADVRMESHIVLRAKLMQSIFTGMATLSQTSAPTAGLI